jgi:hypothetical protein
MACQFIAGISQGNNPVTKPDSAALSEFPHEAFVSCDESAVTRDCQS